jgi:hypothetical protein
MLYEYRVVTSNLLNQRTRNFSVYIHCRYDAYSNSPCQLRFLLVVRTPLLLERYGIWRNNLSLIFPNKKFLSSSNKKVGHNRASSLFTFHLRCYSSAVVLRGSHICHSQWPRGLRHELSSPAQTLGSWVRIHLRHGCLCAFILCLCCPVCRWRPWDGLIPHPRSPTDCVTEVEKLKKRPRSNKGL